MPSSRNTPSPVDPESIQVMMSYEPDPTDLALSSVPGQEAFDPRKCRFSEDELKPKPIIKKARKVFIPDDIKVTVWLHFIVCVCVCSVLPLFSLTLPMSLASFAKKLMPSSSFIHPWVAKPM